MVTPSSFDEAIASLSSNSGDVQLMFPVVVNDLTNALGPLVEVDRGRWNKQPKSIRITLDDASLSLSAERSRVIARIEKSSAGIRISAAEVPLGQWVRELKEQLRRSAERSDDARRALESMIFGDTSD